MKITARKLDRISIFSSLKLAAAVASTLKQNKSFVRGLCRDNHKSTENGQLAARFHLSCGCLAFSGNDLEKATDGRSRKLLLLL